MLMPKFTVMGRCRAADTGQEQQAVQNVENTEAHDNIIKFLFQGNERNARFINKMLFLASSLGCCGIKQGRQYMAGGDYWQLSQTGQAVHGAGADLS
jgi:hypothetical protein